MPRIQIFIETNNTTATEGNIPAAFQALVDAMTEVGLEVKQATCDITETQQERDAAASGWPHPHERRG